ncbi:MAG: ATP-binding cassette domain-containing protein [Mycoplasma sp.]|nr:ATP-binding cassette domain-containing protein [Mycoplasma sp.]
MKINKQTDVKDCGLFILQSFYHMFYNEWIDINKLKMISRYGKKGMNISGLSQTADTIGLKLTPMKGEFEAFKELKINKPIITLIGNKVENHYIIITSYKNDKIYFLDPISGKKSKMNLKTFKELFLGVIIYVEKTSIKNKNKKQNNFIESILKFKKHIPALLISICLTIIFNMSSSILLKVIVDKVIPAGMHNTLLILILGFSTLGVIGVINNGVRNYIIYKIYLRINRDMFLDINYRIKNTELEYLNKLTKVDILRRINLIEPISLFLSSAFFSIFLETTSLIISLSFMLWIKPELLLISIIGSIVIILIILLNKNLLNKKYDNYIKKQLDLNSNIFDTVNTLKQNRTKEHKDYSSIKTEKSFLSFKNKDLSIWNLNNVFDALEETVSSLLPIIVIGFATNMVIENKLSIGLMVLFLSMMNYFLSPLKNISHTIMKYPLIKKEMEMLDFIYSLPLEKKNIKGIKIDEIKKIEFKNFKFSYEVDKPILSFKKFEINDSIHLIGNNGTGKTTLLNIINFNYLPKGVSINGIPSKQFYLEKLREQVYTNQPNDFLPKQTVMDYATLGDPLKLDKFIKNITRNGVLKIMKDKNIYLDATILNNGENFSSGQKQIIKLLPLFSSNYSIIIIDEGLENLDIDTRLKISKVISKEQENAKFIEISHTGKFIKEKSKEVNIEKID